MRKYITENLQIFFREISREPGRTHFLIWILINAILCQSPLFFMYVSNLPDSTIFSSGLSYIFTLFIASLYTRITMGEKTIINEIDQQNLWYVVALIAIIFTFGLLCLYPNIKKSWLHVLLVDWSWVSYFIIMVTSLTIAFGISWPHINSKITETKERMKAEEPIKKSDATEETLEESFATLQEESFE